MDWTLEDNMVNSSVFCATPTSCRSSHTPFVQTGAETSGTRVEVIESNPRCQLRLRNFFQRGQLSDVFPVGPFVYFQTIEKFAMASGLIPATILRAVLGSAIPGGCFGDKSTKSLSAFQLFSIPPHFCFCRQMNSWTSEGQGRWCLTPLDFEIIGKKTLFFQF